MSPPFHSTIYLVLIYPLIKRLHFTKNNCISVSVHCSSHSRRTSYTSSRSSCIMLLFTISYETDVKLDAEHLQKDISATRTLCSVGTAITLSSRRTPFVSAFSRPSSCLPSSTSISHSRVVAFSCIVSPPHFMFSRILFVYSATVF